MRRRHISITWLLIGGVGGLLTVSLAVTLTIGLKIAQENTRELLRGNAETRLAQVIDEIEHSLEPAARLSASLSTWAARDPRRLSGDNEDLLSRILNTNPSLRGVAFIKADGTRFGIGRDGEIIRDRWRGIADLDPDFRRSTGTSWTDPLFSPIIAAPLIVARTPVVVDDEFLGLVAVGVSLEDLSRFLTDLNIPTGAAFILHGHEELLAHAEMARSDFVFSTQEHPLPPVEMIGDTVVIKLAKGEVDRTALGPDTESLSTRFVRLDDGIGHVIHFRTLNKYNKVPWTIGIHQQVTDTERGAPVRRLYIGGGVGIAVILMSIGVLVLLARRIRRPIRTLAQQSRNIRDLDLNKVEPLPPSFITELDEAADAFDGMVRGLRWFETYLPKRLVRQLLATQGENAIRSRSREVTVLFTDIVGFTSVSENAEAEQVANLLNEHFALINRCIEAEDGTVDKYIGDSVMAFWGAPSEQPDHAARACRAAQAIAEAIHLDNKSREARGEPPVHLRIGLHSGPALVGNIGTEGRMNYTLVGDVVNIANRLEQFGKEVAPWDEVCVIASGETVEQTNGSLENMATQLLGEHPLRGRESLTKLHRLL